MKIKSVYMAYLAAAVVTAAGCSDHDASPADATDGTPARTVTVTLDASVGTPGTRTAYAEDEANDRLAVTWKATDAIGVFTATSNAMANASGTIPDGGLSANGKSARFTATLNGAEATERLYAYYPRQNTVLLSPREIQILLTGQQQTGFPSDPAHLSAYDYMAALPVDADLSSGADAALADLTFRPVLAVMSFDVANPTAADVSVKSVQLAALGGEKVFHTLALMDITQDGGAKLDYASAGLLAESSVTLGAAECTIPSGETRRFSMMMLPVAADAMPERLCITVTADDGSSWSQITAPPADAAIGAGERYIISVTLPEVWSGVWQVPYKKDKTYYVTTAEELEHLRTYNGQFIGDTVQLLSDIDLGGREWTPWGQFSGTFEGNGHTIRGLSVTKVTENDVTYTGLFGRLMKATVNNLHTAGTISVTAPEGYTREIQAGGIAGNVYGSTLNGCTSACTVTVSRAGTGGTTYAGGIAGYATRSCTFSGVAYTGAADGVTASGGGTSCTGGIIGNADPNGSAYAIALTSPDGGSFLPAGMTTPVIGYCRIFSGTVTVDGITATNGKPYPPAS